MRDDRLRVLIWHIRDVASEIADFVASHTREEVRSDLFRERGLVHSLYIVADLATRLQNEHPEFVADLPGVAWRDIRGLRNRIAHSYFEINHDVVWAAAVNEVPDLARELMAKLKEPPHTAT
jgi:uncharacterized protein with HEPN domain